MGCWIFQHPPFFVSYILNAKNTVGIKRICRKTFTNRNLTLNEISMVYIKTWEFNRGWIILQRWR